MHRIYRAYKIDVHITSLGCVNNNITTLRKHYTPIGTFDNIFTFYTIIWPCMCNPIANSCCCRSLFIDVTVKKIQYIIILYCTITINIQFIFRHLLYCMHHCVYVLTMACIGDDVHSHWKLKRLKRKIHVNTQINCI